MARFPKNPLPTIAEDDKWSIGGSNDKTSSAASSSSARAVHWVDRGRGLDAACITMMVTIPNSHHADYEEYRPSTLEKLTNRLRTWANKVKNRITRDARRHGHFDDTVKHVDGYNVHEMMCHHADFIGDSCANNSLKTRQRALEINRRYEQDRERMERKGRN